MKKLILYPPMTIINKSLINLPTPSNISMFWNFGSLLGLCLLTQLITGFMLTMHYTPNTNYAFNSIIHIMQNINYGWLLRLIHMNGASMFFLCMYMHIGRGMYFSSYKLKSVWMIGVMLIFMLMGTAFMGYVLPWGQMSFWGATVITNLLSALPIFGQMLVEWLWGGFSVNNATLNRFYSFHFILPFILTFMVMLHLFLLHQTGSSNPLGLNSKFNMIKFHSYFTLKDLVGFMIMMYMILLTSLEYPYMLGDSENFLMANPLVTPTHIQPEWYFLFAYTILRSIPNKLGGVMALFMSIFILMIKPFMPHYNFQSTSFYFVGQIMFWLFVNSMILLTWLGKQLVETPYTEMSQILTIMYFSYFLINPLMKMKWDFMMNKYT